MNNFTQNLLCDLSNIVELSQDQKFQPKKLHCYKNMCQTISFYFIQFGPWTAKCRKWRNCLCCYVYVYVFVYVAMLLSF